MNECDLGGKICKSMLKGTDILCCNRMIMSNFLCFLNFLMLRTSPFLPSSFTTETAFMANADQYQLAQSMLSDTQSSELRGCFTGCRRTQVY